MRRRVARRTLPSLGQGIVVKVFRHPVLLSLEELIDDATLVVHARGVGHREQVSIPDSIPGYADDLERRELVCEWVVFVEVEIEEYLKGEGPDMLRLVLPADDAPLLQRPLVRVKAGQDVKEGREYVLFLVPRRYPESWGLGGQYWAPLGGRQGRWEFDGGAQQYGGTEPAVNQIPIDELREAISAQLSP